MFGRANVLIRSYEDGHEFERAVFKLARQGYEIAELNGQRADLTLDPASGAYLPRHAAQVGLPVTVTFVRAGNKAAGRRARASQG